MNGEFFQNFIRHKIPAKISRVISITAKVNNNFFLFNLYLTFTYPYLFPKLFILFVFIDYKYAYLSGFYNKKKI